MLRYFAIHRDKVVLKTLLLINKRKTTVSNAAPSIAKNNGITFFFLAIFIVSNLLVSVGGIHANTYDNAYRTHLKNFLGREPTVNDPDPWGFFSLYCTSYVAFRAYHAGWASKYQPYYWGHAVEWKSKAKEAGLTVSKEPKAGSIAYWDNSIGDWRGHVAWVESVSGDYVTVTEYNYGTDNKFGSRKIHKSNPVAYLYPPGSTSTSIEDGDVIRVGNTATVYVVAGGAAMPFYSRAGFEESGYKWSNIKSISQADFNKLNSVPRDKTLLRGHDNTTVYVSAGGASMPFYSRAGFEDAGYSWGKIIRVDSRAIQNKLSSTPSDRTLLRGHDNATVYVAAGGAAMPFYSRSALEGHGYTWSKVVKVDSRAIGKRLSNMPKDKTILKGHDSDTVFVSAGGAAMPFYSREAFEDLKYSWGDLVRVDSRAIQNKLGTVPDNGTVLKGQVNDTVYVSAGDAAMPFYSRAGFEESGYSWGSVVRVDARAIEQRFNDIPADETLLRGHESDRVYIVAGEARLPFYSREAFDNAGYSWSDVIKLDSGAIDNRLADTPVDGTVLIEHDTHNGWSIVSGMRYSTVDIGIVADRRAIENFPLGDSE